MSAKKADFLNPFSKDVIPDAKVPVPSPKIADKSGSAFNSSEFISVNHGGSHVPTSAAVVTPGAVVEDVEVVGLLAVKEEVSGIGEDALVKPLRYL